MQPKNTKRQTQGPTRLYELFLLTLHIEEVARWQYMRCSDVIDNHSTMLEVYLTQSKSELR